MSDQQGKTRIAVIGLGNELMADDGVGVHAIHQLRGVLPADVPCIEIGTAALRAESVCEEADVVIAVDAVQAGDRPGSVYAFDLADAEVPRAESLHSLSLVGLIGLMAPDRRPQGVVVGVEPARVEYGMALSEPVQAALPRVIRVVCGIVKSGGALAPAMAVLGRSCRDMAPIEEKL